MRFFREGRSVLLEEKRDRGRMGSEVVLHVYDLSNGMARSLSGQMLGLEVEALYHTGVHVFGEEYFYGGGIQRMPHDQVVAQFGLSPVERLSLGSTRKTLEDLLGFLRSVSGEFHVGSYDLFHNNCNNFSDRLCKFLLDGQGIPEKIIELPNRILNTPLGQLVAPIYQGMQQQMQQQLVPFNAAAAEGSGFSSQQQAPDVSVEATHSTKTKTTYDDSVDVNGDVELTIKVSNREEQLKVRLESLQATVIRLKRAVERVSGIQVEDQRVIFKGRFLKEDDHKLSEFGIAPETVVHVVPKPISQASSQTLSGTQSSNDPVDQALNRMRAAPSKERTIALKTLQKIVQNVVDYPLEDKYKKIKRENKALTKRLSIDGAVDFLVAIGFKEKVESDEKLLVIEANEAAWKLLLAGKEKIDQEVEFSMGSQQQQQPQPAQGGFGGFSGMDSFAGNSTLRNQLTQQLLQNPEMLRSMMNSPMIQQMMQNYPPQIREMFEQTFSNPDALRAMMNNPMFANAAQQFGNFNPGTFPGNTNTANGNNNNSNVNGGANDEQMSEEEMIQEAIRRSLQEQ